MSDDVGAGAGTDAAAAEPRTPFLRVVRGDATAEEVAALVAVLGSLQGQPEAAPRPRPAWSVPGRSHRRGLRHGPGGWRSSGLPG